MPTPSVVPEGEAPLDCPRCPRLVAFRETCRAEHPDWWNAPVPAWGDRAAWLAVVGMAPGKHGANRTGRPFTGDHAGVLLFDTLKQFGLATGDYRADPDDGFTLTGCAIVNAVKCLPPANKPTPEEARNCRPFLAAQLPALTQVRVIVPLGAIAHDSTCRALGLAPSRYKFGHLAEHPLPDGRVLIDSYHCSRYNQNTGRLTATMFQAVFARALEVR